jgi:hypothetical protein
MRPVRKARFTNSLGEGIFGAPEPGCNMALRIVLSEAATLAQDGLLMQEGDLISRAASVRRVR